MNSSSSTLAPRVLEADRQGHEEAPSASKRSSAQPLPAELQTILLADDDPGIRQTLASVLESEQFHVVTAASGEEAAQKLLSNNPDLILLDLNMPNGDGWSAYRFINSMQPMLPVIIITARPNQGAKAQAIGADAFMEKPLNISVLIAAIKQLLAEPPLERMHRLARHEFNTALLDNQIAPA